MFRLILPIIMLVMVGTPVQADENPKASNDDIRKRVESYLDQALPGVFYSEEKDTTEGRIVRLFAVGTAPIRQSLGEEDGLEHAQQQAQIVARAELARFLASKVSMKMTSRNEVVITSASGEGDKESAKKTERRTREYEETATAVLRGLKIVGAQQVADAKRYVVVYRWDVIGTEAAGDVRDRMEGKPGFRSALPVKLMPEKRIVIGE